MILVLLLLLGGGAVVGLSMLGIVKVPFLPFGKKKASVKAPKDDGKGGPFAEYLTMADAISKQAAAKPAAAKSPPPPKPDSGPGEAKLATLWAEMPADKLAAMVGKWPEAELGRILAKMDEDAVTGLLAALPPERAASLSRAVAAATDESAAKVHTDASK